MSLRYMLLAGAAFAVLMVVLVARVLVRPSGTNASGSSSPPPQTRVNGDGVVLPDPTAPPELAEAPGKDVFLAACVNCHSARYVTMQPRFSRKVWTGEVTKMVSAYKAQVTPDQQEQIVNYLVAAYGTPDASK